MDFRIILTDSASKVLDDLSERDSDKLKKVHKTLGLMQTDLKHPSLQTHVYESLSGPNDEKVFESYVENKTPAAFRVFWYYGPDKGVITVVAITAHRKGCLVILDT